MYRFTFFLLPVTKNKTAITLIATETAQKITTTVTTTEEIMRKKNAFHGNKLSKQKFGKLIKKNNNWRKIVFIYKKLNLSGHWE